MPKSKSGICQSPQFPARDPQISFFLWSLLIQSSYVLRSSNMSLKAASVLGAQLPMAFHTATSSDFETLLKGAKSHSETLHLGYSQRNFPVCTLRIPFKETQHKALLLCSPFLLLWFWRGYLHWEGRLSGKYCESTLISHMNASGAAANSAWCELVISQTHWTMAEASGRARVSHCVRASKDTKLGC